MRFFRPLAIICLLLGCGGALAQAEELRIGLLGPSRADPHWQFFKRGLVEAAADKAVAIEWIDETPWDPTVEAQQRAALSLSREPLDAVIVWPLVVDELAEARIGWVINEVRVYTLVNALPPGESAGHLAVDWVALSTAVHIAAVDLSPRPEGTILFYKPADGPLQTGFDREWLEVLRRHPAWPATGAWSWSDGGTGARPASPLAAVVVPEFRSIQSTGGLPPGTRSVPKVALSIDSFALQALASKRVHALIVPHFAEAARGLLLAILRDNGLAEDAAPVFAIGPLVVTSSNEHWWRAWWQRWER